MRQLLIAQVVTAAIIVVGQFFLGPPEVGWLGAVFYGGISLVLALMAWGAGGPTGRAKAPQVRGAPIERLAQVLMVALSIPCVAMFCLQVYVLLTERRHSSIGDLPYLLLWVSIILFWGLSALVLATAAYAVGRRYHRTLKT